MSDWTRVVLGGVAIFVIGQLALRFLIDPVIEQSKTIGEVAFALVFYAPYYLRKPASIEVRDREELHAVSDTIRDRASRLVAANNAIKLYWLYRSVSLRTAPPRRDVLEAARKLMFICNSVFHPDPEGSEAARKEIIRLLRLNIGELFSR